MVWDRVEKLDTSFQLDRITEGEAIKMATSHLEDEGTQDHGKHVDTPSMTQGSPVLETSLTISVDILIERVEPTPVVPSIEVMTGVVSESSGGSSTRQMGEVPRDVSTFDEALGDIEVLDDGRTQQCH